MDTTAAAELGGSLGEGSIGYWDTGAEEVDVGWNEKGGGSQPSSSWGEGRAGNHARGGRNTGENGPPLKRMRNMEIEEVPYTSGSGNFNNFGGGNAGGSATGNGSGSRNFGSGGLGPSGGSPGMEPVQGGSRGRGTGSIFYKTKLCSRFRNGNCPYNTNCNFAHGMEELRKPPPGWEDVVAAQEGGGGGSSSPPQRTAATPGNGERTSSGNAGGGMRGTGGNGGADGGLSNSEAQRFHKTRLCKKYQSDVGCPYGDRCNFLHEEPSSQAKTSRETPRESGPGTGSMSSVSGSGTGGGGGGPAGSGSGTLRPPNWKTRLCNKWETTGSCPFGDKCHFAHGAAELQKYGGGPLDSTSEVGAGAQMDPKVGVTQPSTGDGDDGLLPSYGDSFFRGTNGRHLPTVHISKIKYASEGEGGLKCLETWRGPRDRISTIYGDWLDEEDCEQPPGQLARSTSQQENVYDANSNWLQAGWSV